MKIDTNTPVSDLCYVLRALADFLRVLPEDSVALLECADRLELLAVENEDLRNQNHSNRVAAEARWDEIQSLLQRIGKSRDYENEASDLSDELRRSNRHIDRLNDYINCLIDTGDAMVPYATTPTKTAWKEAKEAKP